MLKNIMYVYVCGGWGGVYVRARACVCVCVHKRARACMCVSIYSVRHIYGHLHTQARMHACKHVYVRMYINK